MIEEGTNKNVHEREEVAERGSIFSALKPEPNTLVDASVEALLALVGW